MLSPLNYRYQAEPEGIWLAYLLQVTNQKHTSFANPGVVPKDAGSIDSDGGSISADVNGHGK